MGKSRSVTITLAYLLSTRPETCPNVPTALALIRQTRPHAEPNSGFMAQLELYKAMGCPIDIDAEPMYQRWLYRQEVEMSLAVGRAPDRLRFEDEEDKTKENETSSSGERDKELRCRKCRRTLATRQYLIPHTPKTCTTSSTTTDIDTQTGPIASLPSVNSPTTPTQQPCTHYFIQPLSWMRPTLSEGSLSGRLECPNAKCGQQVGRYAWQGLKCSCGHWVVPGFSLAAGKVDELVVFGKGAGAAVPGVRMPPGVKGSL
jgi:dual specificity phosphatase 12